MADNPDSGSAEQAALAAMETRLFGPAEEENPQEANAPEVAQEELSEEAAPVESDLEEIEADDGEKFQVPKKLKEAFLRQKDYTSKTMEVAEHRRNVALQMEAMQAQQAFDKHVAPKRKELDQVQSELQQFKSIDATQLDSDQLMRLQMRISSLKEKASEIEQGLQSDMQQFVQWHGQHRRQLAEQGTKFLQTVIPSWGAEAAKAATDAASAIGYTKEELDQAFDPRFVRMAWESAQYRKLMNSKGQAVANAQKAPPVIKPGSSDPAMQNRMQNLNWHKAMKGAKTTGEKVALAEQRMTKFFGS